MNKKLDLNHLLFLTVCLTLGLISKRFISPATNILTDLVRIPGGSTATGISFMFLVLGRARVSYNLAGTLMGFTQGCLSLMLGFSGHHGALALLTYTIPGLVIDLVPLLLKERNLLFFLSTAALANLAGATFTNLLVFHLQATALLLWLLLAVCAGCLGGALGHMLYCRIPAVIHNERVLL